ncbi:hypothetical protein B0T21DRAFT_359764 [Apiosordaria backusii]|uniref:DUF6594 domain-containing protein n=1 Tax=Apiosordaria backusii TaxID=314023 RepID=A0AA40ELN1_9PEZI|nr:hypothetical protein B0T21DRAFT_359764 [Apiosordaria backusii]
MESDNKNLVEYVKRSLEAEEEFHFLRFEFLQRLNITQIQLDLIRMKSNINGDGALSDVNKSLLTSRLADYATAINNYHTLRSKRLLPRPEMRRRKFLLQRFFQSQTLDKGDPFSSHYSYFTDDTTHIDPLRALFMHHLPSWFTFSHEERIEREKEYNDGKPPKDVSTPVDRLARLSVAITGGAFLIVPMLIMTLPLGSQSELRSLVTVTMAVLLFALCLGFVVKVSNVETLVATATYAAVLVVFVGTSQGGSGGGFVEGAPGNITGIGT